MPFQPRAIPTVIRSLKNNTGSTIPKGAVVKLSTATDDLMLLPAAVADAHFGVAMNDIPTGQIGDIQIGGQAIVLAGTGGVTRGARLTHDTAIFGRVIPASPAGGTNNALIGIARRAAANGELFEAELCPPGSMLQG